MGSNGSVNFPNNSYISSVNNTMDISDKGCYHIPYKNGSIDVQDNTKSEFINTIAEMLKFYVYKENRNE